MAERKITTKIELTGEAQYKQALSSLSSSLKLYNSELSILKTKYKDAQNSTEYLTQKGNLLNKVQQTQSERIKVLKNALDSAKKAQETYNQKIEEAALKVEEAQKEIDKLKDTVGEESDEYRNAQKAFEQYNQELEQAKGQQEQCTKAVEKYQSQLNNAEAQQDRTNDQIKKNSQYLKEAKSSADGCATSIDQFGKRVRQSAADVDKSSEALKKNAGAIDFLTNAVVISGIEKTYNQVKEAIEQCVDAAGQFETSIAKLQTISGAAAIGDLSEEILKLSSDTGIAASSLSNTAYNAISAGTAVSDAVGMAENASKLAIAGFTDTDSALSVLTTTINAYGDSAGTATQISDSLIQVQNLGVTTVAELAANMGKAIATASAYGVNLSNLEAAYISTTKSGINTAESTTYLSSMFKELGDTGTDVSKVIQDKTGMSFGKLMQSGASLGDVLKILMDYCDGDSEALMNLWSSAEAGKAANAILNQGITEFNNNLKTVQDSAGATEEAYQTMADTSEMAGQRAATAFENLKIAIGSELTPIVTDAQSEFADLTEKITEFVKNNPQVVTAIGAVAVGLGVFAGAVVAVNIAVKVLIPLIKELMLTMSTNPVGLLVTAVTALVSALVFLAANTEEATGAAADYNEAIESAKDATDGLTESFTNAKQAFADTSSEIQATSKQAGDLVSQLEKLANKSHKSNEDIDQMGTLVTELNTLYPELNLTLDETTGSLSMTNDEMERFINNAKNTATITAYEELLQEETDALVAAEKNLINSKESLSTADDEYNALLKEQAALTEKQEAAVKAEDDAYQAYVDTLNDVNATYEEREAAEQAYTDAKLDSENATKELKDWTDQYYHTLQDCTDAQTDANDAVEQAEAALNDAQTAVDDTAAAYEDYKFKLTDVGDACQTTFDKTNQMLEAMDDSTWVYDQIKSGLEIATQAHLDYQAQAQETYDKLKTKLTELKKKYDEATQSVLNNLKTQIGGLDEANLEIQYSCEQLAANFQSQAEYLSNYMNNITAITTASGIQMTDEFLSFLTSGSSEAVQVAASMAAAISSGQIESANETITAYTNVQTTLAAVSQSATDARGEYSSKMGSIKDEMQDCVDGMKKDDEAYNNTLTTLQKAINGAEEMTDPLIHVYEYAGDLSVDSLDKSGDMYGVGVNNVSGAIRGAQSMSASYVAVYVNMANQAIAQLRRVDQQHSPSKLYERHAKLNVQGAVIGAESMKKEYVSAYADMAASAIDSYNRRMEDLTPLAIAATEQMMDAAGGIDISSKINHVWNYSPYTGISEDIINAIDKLRKDINRLDTGASYTINGVTYDDGSNISDAVQALVRAARIGRRT